MQRREERQPIKETFQHRLYSRPILPRVQAHRPLPASADPRWSLENAASGVPRKIDRLIGIPLENVLRRLQFG